MNINTDTLNLEVDRIVAETGASPGDVIPLLHAVQKKFNYLPEIALRRICEITDITPAAITGISTFYPQFRHTPVGQHIIHVCTGTACHVKGADLVWEAFRRELHITENQDTDPEGQFTLQKVSCLGCCTLAPVVQIDNVTYGKVKPDRVTNVLNDFLSYPDKRGDSIKDGKDDLQEESEIKIGLGSCCIASGSGKVQQALEKCFDNTGVSARVKRVGCVGMCHRAPLLEVCLPDKEPVLYDKVQAEEVKNIVLRYFKPKTFSKRIKNAALNMVENILEGNPANGMMRRALYTRDPHIQAFTGRQQHIATEHSGQIDPLDLEEYRSKGGFKALEQCLAKFSPDEIIEQIKMSGLRGRGGAGFPSWQKLQEVRQAKGDKKFIICNGDEGDPGAFMDRMILESYPFRVIEGMLICAYAVGASEGYFYIRAEYPLAVQRVKAAIQQYQGGSFRENRPHGPPAKAFDKDLIKSFCRVQGRFFQKESLAAGGNKSGFSLNIKIMEGAGAFVCGEETALIASIEGKRGMPQFRPPYPSQQGLWGCPTLVNNCETFATVPWILRNGPEAFAKLGNEKSKGTKVFSLAGKIVRGGLIEVPMGITIHEIVEEIGGGIENGRPFKAVQIGGPSGGCVPAELAHTRVDYEDLTKVGAMMGSGGLLVMDDTDCMVDIARYFLTFTCSQSCGKCTFCRIGTRLMLNILENLCTGKGSSKDLKDLEEIAGKTKQGSLCGLGKTAPNPVLTTLRYFREEYEAHLKGTCPAKRCKALIIYSITGKCIGCTICAQQCPAKAIPITPYKKHEILQEKCIKCGTCKNVCPNEAVTVT
ncbi:MAG: 4Fe-4S dicluster domain-containing protein [Candidatus Aminicenantes bacterium]|nr:4Fe-4S dicluster domain-containing protein [Candidatus Aminicenantes bacterium]NIM81025.1 4Fe-4S dicluster domain-containing protein [Candidatus Aminicenantes bacterium]NIN20404.1 4Fe-4S dicluster domain-containing protein [Candidatus Aminicenantes bacterium]NIN44177.1 4Fe-4S dicluster domain-containing protein [Candidatus Aminicenantes bacterium]NIN86995.1 4Fe-4S dicluster domain-containing protein [Candidatus Aminicenantes bacterium]